MIYSCLFLRMLKNLNKAQLSYSSSATIAELITDWLLSLRSKRTATNMNYPFWNSELELELSEMSKCEPSNLPPVLSLESSLTIQRFPIDDPYNIKSVIVKFRDDFLSNQFSTQLVFSKLSQYACTLDVCREPTGKYDPERPLLT